MNCALMTVFTILKGGKVLLGINNFVVETVSCIRDSKPNKNKRVESSIKENYV